MRYVLYHLQTCLSLYYLMCLRNDSFKQLTLTKHPFLPGTMVRVWHNSVNKTNLALLPVEYILKLKLPYPQGWWEWVHMWFLPHPGNTIPTNSNIKAPVQLPSKTLILYVVLTICFFNIDTVGQESFEITGEAPFGDLVKDILFYIYIKTYNE